MKSVILAKVKCVQLLISVFIYRVSGWSLVYRSTPGLGNIFDTEWSSPNGINENVTSLQTLSSSKPGTYKSQYIESWSGVSKVKMTFNKQGSLAKEIIFLADGATKITWHDKSKIISSSFDPIKNNTNADLSNLMTGISFAAWDSTTSGCTVKLWWGIVSNTTCNAQFLTSAKVAPQFVYSSTGSAVSASSLQYADVFAIYLEYNINCTVPPELANASRTAHTSLAVDSKVTYTCSGLKKFPDGQQSVESTCLPTGKWSVTKPHPCQVHCSQLPVSNAIADKSSSSFPEGTLINYMCETGFRFADNSTSKGTTCLSTGKWSDETMQCNEIKCSALAKYSGTSYDTTETSYKTTVTLSCDKGYNFHDSTLQRTTWCGDTGEWVYKVKGCQDVTCPPAPSFKNCDNTPLNNTYGTEITYTCHQGKRMEDGSTFKIIKCTARGVWSDNVTECETNRCVPLLYVPNSKPSTTNAVIGSTVTITCNTGYFFENNVKSRTMQCKTPGVWDPLLPACDPVKCPPVFNYSNTDVNTTVNLYATRVKYSCELGYRFPDNETVKVTECKVTKVWSIDVKPCSIVHCPVHGDITNATKTGSGTRYASEIGFKCFEGYRFLDGKYERTIRCTEHAVWNETGFDCRTDRCGPIPDVKNAIPSTYNTTWWTVVYYTCEPGYRFPDNTTVKLTMCTVDAIWNTTVNGVSGIPDCEPLPCPAVPLVANATGNSSAVHFPSVIGYSCDKGHRFPGDALTSNIQCTASGNWVKWAPTLPGCQPVHCPTMPRRVNATSDTNNTVYGTVAVFTCFDGFEFDVGGGTNQSIECNEYAMWSPNVSDCHPVICPPLPTYSDMTFNDTNREYGTVVTYYCHEDYIYEDIKKDPKTLQPGVNDGNRTSFCTAGMWWEPAVYVCVDAKGIMDDLKGVTYEADGAVSIGTVALALVCTLLCVIVLLDSFKLYSDLKFMAGNLKCFYERIRERMNKNKECESKNSLQKLIYDKF